MIKNFQDTFCKVGNITKHSKRKWAIPYIKSILIIPHAMSRTKNVHILESQKKEWLKKKKKPKPQPDTQDFLVSLPRKH